MSDESKRYTVDCHEDRWVLVVADVGMCCRPTTTYWHAYGAAEQANAKKLEVKDWKRVLEMIETMDPNYTILCPGLLPSDHDAGLVARRPRTAQTPPPIVNQQV